MREQAEAVSRMQDYIKEHLEETITLADLSRVSLFSPWHSYRLFRQWTGLTPADYIRRLRLSVSALKLRDEQCRIADVAFEYGFGSVDGYQRAFFREFGCNPREYARNPVPLYLFTPYGVKYRTMRRERNEMENVKNVFIQAIDKPQRRVVIKRGIKAEDYSPYCEEVGCDVIDLPVAQYLMFQGEPFEEEDYCEAIEAVRMAIERYEPSAAGYQWDKENPRIQLEPVGTRGYIELLPVKNL